MKKSMEYEKIFIDSNIFLDYFNNSRPLNYSATKFFQKIATQSNIQLYTSCDIIISNDKNFTSKDVKVLSSKKYIK